MATYSVEYAKSGRASCKKSKEKIPKGALRIGQTTNNGDYDMTSWFLPQYFTIPRKLGCTPEEFVEQHLEDKSEDGSILPDKAEELIAALESFKKKSPGKKKKGGGDSYVDGLKEQFEATQDDDDGSKKKKGKKKRKAEEEEEDSPADKKKPKKDSSSKEVTIYGKYHKMNVEQLKDYLRWNNQVLKGTKTVVLHKVIDGEMNGRLARCTSCQGGQLKINEPECTKVICSGAYDEAMNMRIPCSATYTFEDAPRWHPWYTEEPSEEEKAAMEKLISIAKGEEEDDADVDPNSPLGKLMAGAADLELDMSTTEGKKKAANTMLEYLEDADLDLPEEEKAARKAVGKIMVENDDGKTNAELVQLIVKEFGFAKAKAEKEEKKKESAKADVACADNAQLFLAFKELAELYFKEGNRNAGMSYQKVSGAIKGLKIAVTEDNAKGMAKGKTKVEGIGKSSADKMYEFVTTGTIEKLEEKRAAAS